MCGRFVIATPLVSIFEYFDIHDPRVEDRGPRFNVAPSTPILIVRDDGEARSLDTAQWGFTPAWAKTLDDGPRPINARSETVGTSKLFRRAYEQRRCLIPADGFYEWQARTGQRKQPYYIHRSDGTMLALGGIWETWHEGDDNEMTSTAIITTPANDRVNELHHRMPLVLEKEDWSEWLMGDNPEPLLRPAAEDTLTWHPVTTSVGNVRNDNPELIEPLDED
jgi:putative SOS response-associated peptidase YedK